MEKGSKDGSPLLHEELGCEGYWGFASGWFLARVGKVSDELYCNACPVQEGCWEKHKQRCAELVPAAVAKFEEIAAKHEGNPQAMMQEWFALAGGPDPYVAIGSGNIQDGTNVGAGQMPEDRGPLSLPKDFWGKLVGGFN